MVPPSGRTAGSPAKSQRLDRAVVWSVTLQMISLPLMLLLLVGVALAASSMGIVLGSDDDLGAQRTIIAAYMALVLAPLVASVVIGFVGWRRRGRKAALAAASVSGALIVLFMLVVGTLV